uniref:Ycf15 protein n=1 Tax=Gentiana apiata TaxID=2709848 RepID=A0A6C0W1W3_9GENT|nr:Ycf15 protein [Gentiana apiata]YP_009738908.1 Ycf15 protein [Gentiana apiata]QIC19287.1 Ycf15 protein [Gentiana apiata]QIC19288.1 Ycf15 protein [Gentiana apiata]UFP91442.1 Ycf15 protein [Gentiana apiata]UFP91443.1 Ycf15 protein [Gentiana apiata]
MWMGGRVVETPASSIFLTLAPLKSWIKTDGMNCLNKNY